MKKASKIISVLMVAIMTLSTFAVSASAVATPLVAGNTKETATTIPNYGVEYTSELSKAGEQDWFKFTTLSEDAYYTIALKNYNISESSTNGSYKASLNLYVYDIYNQEIAHLYRNTLNTNIELEKNTTYYIKVAMGSSMTGSTGNYGFSVNCDTASAPNDPNPPENPDNNNNNNTSFDFMSILTAIWDAIVWLFNFLMGLVGAM